VIQEHGMKVLSTSDDSQEPARVTHLHLLSAINTDVGDWLLVILLRYVQGVTVFLENGDG
jgi:hypothetical protein